jgi:hypothetical protein
MENPLAGKARQENDLSRAPMDLTNSEFDEQLYYQVYAKLLATVTHDRQKCTCLAILGWTTQLSIFLCMLHSSRLPRQVQYCLSLVAIASGFAKKTLPI